MSSSAVITLPQEQQCTVPFQDTSVHHLLLLTPIRLRFCGMSWFRHHEYVSFLCMHKHEKDIQRGRKGGRVEGERKRREFMFLLFICEGPEAFLEMFSTSFETGLTGRSNHLASGRQRFAYHHLPFAGITSTSHRACILMWAPETETGSSGVRAFTD